MNILVVGKFYSEGFASHITESLKYMGHSVMQFQPGRSYFLPSSNKYLFIGQKVYSKLCEAYSNAGFWDRRAAEKLLSLLNSNEIDLIISCHDFLKPKEIELIKKKYSCKIVLWYPDHIGAFSKSMFLNASYDCLFFKDPYIVKTLSCELGRNNIFYLPECCNPIHHNKFAITPEELDYYSCDICTAGNLHASRISVFEHLTEYKVKIWGTLPPTWANTEKIKNMITGKYVINENKSKAFNCSKIVLNNLQPSEIFGVNVRTFEIGASKSFQLLNWRPGLKQLYSEDEMVTYKSIPDLQDKISYYLIREDERLKFAEKAYIKTHSEHTYEHRLNLLIETTFGHSKGYPLLSEY